MIPENQRDTSLSTAMKITPIENIFFMLGETWIMKLSTRGIEFNRSLPYENAEDFAKEVIDCLEKNFEVKFIKKR